MSLSNYTKILIVQSFPFRKGFLPKYLDVAAHQVQSTLKAVSNLDQVLTQFTRKEPAILFDTCINHNFANGF